MIGVDHVRSKRWLRASNGSLTLTGYDQAKRPVRSWARDASAVPVTLREIMIYGESADAGLAPGAVAAGNLLGQLYQHHDEAGRVSLTAADLTSAPLDKVGEVIADAVVAGASPFAVDWQPPAGTALPAHAAGIPQAWPSASRMASLRTVELRRWSTSPGIPVEIAIGAGGLVLSAFKIGMNRLELAARP